MRTPRLRRAPHLILGVLLTACPSTLAAGSSHRKTLSKRHEYTADDLKFAQRLGLSPAGEGDATQRYDLARETFQLYLPKTGKAKGVLVWISSGRLGLIPEAWAAELRRRSIAVIAANKAGNDRAVLIRAALALDGLRYVLSREAIEPKSIWVAGDSGGAKVASLLAWRCPELFAGALFVAGALYHRALPVEKGLVYPAGLPDPGERLAELKTKKLVWIVGDKDEIALQAVGLVAWAARDDGFAQSSLILAPGLPHALPEARLIAQALDLLEGKASVGELPPREALKAPK